MTVSAPEEVPYVVGADPAYLLARVALVGDRARVLAEAFRVSDPSPDDPFLGLYLSKERVRWLMSDDWLEAVGRAVDIADQSAVVEADANEVEQEGTSLRLRDLARRVGLSGLDVELLVVAAAPEVDRRFEALYGYLNDDVSRRRATISLALTLVGLPIWHAAARARFAHDAPLLRCGLLEIEDQERPFLGRGLRVPPRVVAWLLGTDTPDRALDDVLRPSGPASGHDQAERVARALDAGVGLIYLREAHLAPAPPVLSALGDRWPLLRVDLGRARDLASDALRELAGAAGREALLTGAALALGPVDEVADLRRACRVLSGFPVPLILHGRGGWDQDWSETIPWLVDLPVTTHEERRRQWLESLGDTVADGVDPLAATRQFQLSVDQVDRAARTAALRARMDGLAVGEAELRAGARTQNGSGLGRLARRIEPAVDWSELIVAPSTREGLEELAIRVRQRDLVLDGWRMRPGGGRGKGVSALFSGDPGTGKTMAAEVVARAIGMDLYVVSLPTVVDKYIGETEKNLERIFAEADGINGILLFDEADAIFGKRSEVKDAHDRFANMEIAYLLQRMESFDGIAVLTTNLRANLDEAFARRLDVVVEFPMPDVDLRVALWDRCLGSQAPRGGDVDLEFCARSFELPGGSIRSAVVTSAYLAAEAGRPVGMVDLLRGIQREYRKLGRLVVTQEFGPYNDLLASADA